MDLVESSSNSYTVIERVLERSVVEPLLRVFSNEFIIDSDTFGH
jgi:hypothetical protein